MPNNPKPVNINALIKEGEGQKIEFKETASSLAHEMVAFANAGGGHIYIGIADDGSLHPISFTNRIRSQITDIARNCDPPLHIKVRKESGGVIAVEVPEGQDKPYKCKDGFYLRTGPNSQKLTRDEVVHLVRYAGKVRFDESVNEEFAYPRDFDDVAWDEFRKQAGYPANMKPADALANIGVADFRDKKYCFTNAAILFFAKKPQRFHPEAMITCVKYRGPTRYDIMDKRQFQGSLLSQLDGAMAFFGRYNAKQIKVTGEPRHEEWEDYPAVAIREAIINALIHRDYFFDSTHIYMHIYDDFIEIDNPGGLIKGLTMADLGLKVARRNRMLADLMQRAGFIENAGTGISRIREALRRNGNPPMKISATNFFSLRLIARPKNLTSDSLTDRQRTLYAFLAKHGPASKTQCQQVLSVGSDTTLSELKALIEKRLVISSGKGKNTRYSTVS